MLRRSTRPGRRGTVLIENAIVYPVLGLLLFGMVVVGMGIFRFQQVAALAREGARWASVHGGQYNLDTGRAMATQSTVYTNAIQPMAVGLDTSKLSYTVTWANPNEMPTYWDSTAKAWKTNTVTVKLTYAWVPELYLRPVTLSSTSVMSVSY
jgi:Flp pilus assembly protein TadG